MSGAAGADAAPRAPRPQPQPLLPLTLILTLKRTPTYLTNSWDGVFGTLFVGTAAATLTSSLWVIFTSTHLVELSQQSALHGTDARDVKEADGILEERMREVHMFYVANPNPSPNPNPNCKPQPQPQPQPQPHP